ncbi:Eco57I restriction-modification methylase domain-containing protein [Niveibacterium terrae]|uniref:Eco57I restriction-modification methylase domain-containing protein n=1 Tax=Niveibacterium terrae TaxID=3373598 RepID=UPI003A8CA4CD
MNPQPSSPPMRNVITLGQVFTPDAIVTLMLALRQRQGSVLEPAAGDGAFARRLPGCVAIECDARVATADIRVMDFFDLPLDQRFDTIIGNPPYVRFQDIATETLNRLDLSRFDQRTNLALFFIEKCLRHLAPGGELIFIVPREFIKQTSARKLNARLFELGTITHWIELGDAPIFAGATPNCAIFRFERDNFCRRTAWRRIEQPDWTVREFVHLDGQLAFTGTPLTVPLADLFDVRVGAVSGADSLFTHPEGNLELVCSHTAESGQTRRMFYNLRHPQLEAHKDALLARRIKPFNESNWWRWGRAYPVSEAPRIYVNHRTRRARPFFTHPCKAFDGAVLALFARNAALDLERATELLNDAVPWEELGFFVDGRYLFTQRSLQTTQLPDAFAALRDLR